VVSFGERTLQIAGLPVNVNAGRFTGKIEGIFEMRFVEALRPGWKKIGVSLFLAYFLGWIVGPILYNISHCSDGGMDCGAATWTGITLSYLLSWPIILLTSLPAKYTGIDLNFETFNPVAPEFVFLWLYYYLLLSTVALLVKRHTTSVVR